MVKTTSGPDSVIMIVGLCGVIIKNSCPKGT